MVSPAEVSAQAARRRTFAVISHPDAGKSTLTEALVAARPGDRRRPAPCTARPAAARPCRTGWRWRRPAASRSARRRCSSPTATCVINLVDTPGHADFSEDTYRVLTAVDSAVMLLDAAKGLEPQTLKLFEVCRTAASRSSPSINKWDRPGRDAARAAGRDPDAHRPDAHAADLAGRVSPGTSAACSTAADRRVHPVHPHRRRRTDRPRGAPRPPTRRAAQRRATTGPRRVEELELLAADGYDHDEELFLARADHPGAVRRRRAATSASGSCSTSLVDLAPPPHRRPRRRRASRAPSRRRSAPWCSRCRPAWTPRTATGSRSRGCARGCSTAATCSPTPPTGQVVRDEVRARSVFGRDRETLDERLPRAT